MRVRGVTADIADDAKLAIGVCERLHVDEWWNRFGEIDAVHEDVRFDDFGVGPASAGGFGKVPFQDLFRWDAGCEAEIYGTAATAAKSADDEDLGNLTAFLDTAVVGASNIFD